MSSYSRSYGFRTNWKGWVTPAIKTIVLICTGVFLVQTLTQLFLPSGYTLFLITELGLVPRAFSHWRKGALS